MILIAVGNPEFRLPVSIGVLVGVLVVSVAQIATVLRIESEAL